MIISVVGIRRLPDDPHWGMLRARATIELDGCLRIHDLRVIEASFRLFVCMPYRRLSGGKYEEICSAITPKCMQEIEDAVLEAYFGGSGPQPAAIRLRRPRTTSSFADLRSA